MNTKLRLSAAFALVAGFGLVVTEADADVPCATDAMCAARPARVHRSAVRSTVRWSAGSADPVEARIPVREEVSHKHRDQ